MTLVTALQLIGVLAPVSRIDLADGRLADPRRAGAPRTGPAGAIAASQLILTDEAEPISGDTDPDTARRLRQYSMR
jgi:hypothetical protein